MHHSIWMVNKNSNKRKQRNRTRTALFKRTQQFCALQWKALMVWWMRWDLMAPLWRLQSLCWQKGSLKSVTLEPSITRCSSGTLRETMNDSYSKVLKSVVKSRGVCVEQHPCCTFVKAETASNSVSQSGSSRRNCAADQTQKTLPLLDFANLFNNDVSCSKGDRKARACFPSCNIFLFWTQPHNNWETEIFAPIPTCIYGGERPLADVRCQLRCVATACKTI